MISGCSYSHTPFGLADTLKLVIMTGTVSVYCSVSAWQWPLPIGWWLDGSTNEVMMVTGGGVKEQV